MEKKLSEITRKEWILYHWLDTETMDAEDRVLIRGFKRTPDEAMEAAEEWEVYESVLNEE